MEIEGVTTTERTSSCTVSISLDYEIKFSSLASMVESDKLQAVTEITKALLDAINDLESAQAKNITAITDLGSGMWKGREDGRMF